MPLDVAEFLPSDGEYEARRGLSEMVMGLVGSEILKIAADVRTLVAAGSSVINLSVGDFAPAEFPIPTALARAVREALDQGHTNYPPSDGLPELRHAIVAYHARTQGLKYPVESVLVAGGARPLLYAAYRSVLNPGESVLYPVPSWNNNHYTHVSDGRAVVVPTGPETAFLPTAEALVPYLPQVRLVVLNSPLNPTGTTFSAETLSAIARALVAENEQRKATGRRSVFLVYDQIYSALVAPDAGHVDPVRLVPECAPYVILIDGISKAFAATGLRVGWSLAPPAVTARMRDLVGHMGAWAPRPEQRATACFLADEAAVTSYLTEIRAGIAARLDVLYKGLVSLRDEGLPVDVLPPGGAIYLSVRLALHGRIEGLRTNEDVRKWVLREAGVAIVPFQAFAYPGDDGWFRLSVGAVGVDACERAVAKLRETLRRAG